MVQQKTDQPSEQAAPAPQTVAYALTGLVKNVQGSTATADPTSAEAVRKLRRLARLPNRPLASRVTMTLGHGLGAGAHLGVTSVAASTDRASAVRPGASRAEPSTA